MYAIKSFLPLLFMAFVWSMSGCSIDSSISYHIINIEGVTWACNISASYISFGSGTESGEPGKVMLPVADGDLLYMFNEDELELYYRYKMEDGHLLAVSFDTVNTLSVHLNGSLALLQVSDESSSWAKFEGLSSPEVKQLSTLYITDNLTEEMIDMLKQQEAAIHGTGLVLENSTEGEALKALLSICRPEWLSLDGTADLNKVNQGEYLTNLELLWVRDETEAVSNMIRCCSNLRSLIITDWEPARGELVDLSELKNLHSLTVADCHITDLSNFEFPTTLTRLHLISCDTLTHIDALENISNLESLSLNGSSRVESLDLINKFTALKWISFPENTQQEEFNNIMSNHSSLEVVEMNDCPLISNLSLLKYQINLKSLIINTEQHDLSQLAELDQLELLILKSELFDDFPEMISQLRAQLPQTEIVPGSGLCMGSGWLLLLLPMVMLARFMVRKTTQSSPLR